jgi:hypothetical protein
MFGNHSARGGLRGERAKGIVTSMSFANGTRLASLLVAAAVLAAASSAMAQGSGCWRAADCREAAKPATPSADFRFDSGAAPGVDFRSSSGQPAAAGGRRLDGEPVTETERQLQRPENMRFRQYVAPTWPLPSGAAASTPDQTIKAYGQ